MKYIGIILFMGAFFLISEEYRKRAERRLCETEDFLAFIEHIRLQMGCFLARPREYLADFAKETFKRTGFCELVESGMSLSEAFSEIFPRLSLRHEEKELLAELFSRLGDGYLEDGIKLLDEGIERLGGLCGQLRESTKKNVKLVSALSATFSVGILFLVL